jgi:glutamate synthase (NADPH) small chain
MGKPTGFTEFTRNPPARRSVDERVKDWRELYVIQPESEQREQAARCMDCGVPFCHQGCPLGNRIPDFNDLLYRGRFREAWLALDSTNNFPEFTGRICPAPCEASCVLALDGAPVTIHHIEQALADRAFEEGWARPRPPAVRTRKSVGVVGSGPAGLAAAVQLNRAGHTVTVYEAADRLGGLLRYGIPDFKMEKAAIDRRVALMRAEGVRFEVGVQVGADPTWDRLRGQHDALLIAIGARRPRELTVPGRALPGVHLAMDYLEQQNRIVAGDAVAPAERIDAAGKRVIILGGGDTGADCLGTAHRQGAASVTQLDLLPTPSSDRPPGNPWPQWPLVLRTGSSHEEGGARGWGLMTQRLEGAGRLERLHAARVRFEEGQLVTEEGAEQVFEADLLFLAMGFVGPETETLAAQLGVSLDPRGNVEGVNGFETSARGVYVAGDAKRGASLVVWAISEGREAARQIDAALRDEAPQLPTRGQQRHFGGR